MDDLATLIAQRPGILAVWVFVFGAIIGSFLNVVVYRLPRGASLNHPASHCPCCEHPIRWYHNLPIVGWLILRGKCFDCGAKISARYPLVELATAVMFVGLAWLDVAEPFLRRTAELNLEREGAGLARLLIVYAADLATCCCLLAAALIYWDRKQVPRRLVIAGIVAAAIVALLAERSVGSRALIQGILIAGLFWISRARIRANDGRS